MRWRAYTPFNDISARDVQRATSQWTAGKILDGSGPCGPALVTVDEIADPQNLRLRTRLNGEVVQDASTANMIFSLRDILVFVTSLMTLVPGDIIVTGTPPRAWASRAGRRCCWAMAEIEGIGTLSNPIVATVGAAAATSGATA